MNLRDLEYFVTVAELKHFGRAADKVFVSQPTLSMQLKKLEEYLGVVLFERTNRQVHLTPAGEMLYQEAKIVLNSAKNLQSLAQTYRDPYQSKIRLGVIPTIAPYFLPKLLPLVRRFFPKLELEIGEYKTEQILQMLPNHELDLALLATQVDDPQLTHIHLFDEPFLLACSSHLDAKKIKAMSDIKDQPLLLLAEGHCLRQQVMQLCQKKREGLAASVHATSLETLRSLVANGMGYTLMPKMAVMPMKGVHYQELHPAPTRSIAFVFRGSTSAPQLRLFQNLAEKFKSVIV